MVASLHFSLRLYRYGCRQEYSEDRVLEVDNVGISIGRQGHFRHEWTFQTPPLMSCFQQCQRPSFPASLYEGILPKLVAVLELTQDPAGVSNPQAPKQDKHFCQLFILPTVPRLQLTNSKFFFQTNNFKNAIAQATW